MRNLTWPAVAVFVAALAALVVLFGLTDDPDMRAQVLRYFDNIVPFLIGAGAGAALGGGVSFMSGYARGYASARRAVRQWGEAGRRHAEAARKATEVMRDAGTELRRAATDSGAAVDALKMVVHDGRTLAAELVALVDDARGAVQLRQEPPRAVDGSGGRQRGGSAA